MTNKELQNRITEKNKLLNTDITYKIIRTKVDEVESVYIGEDSPKVETPLDYKLEGSVIGTNRKGIQSLTLEYLQTRDKPVTVYVKDKYVKLKPQKTLILDTDLYELIDNTFVDLIEDDQTIPEQLYVKGTFIRLPDKVVKTHEDFTYFYINGFNTACEIPSFKTLQVMLMEQGQVCPQVITIDEEDLKRLTLTDPCKNKNENYIERFGRDTLCTRPTAEEEALAAIEKVSKSIEGIGGNIGSGFANAFIDAFQYQEFPLKIKVVDCVNLCQSNLRYYPNSFLPTSQPADFRPKPITSPIDNETETILIDPTTAFEEAKDKFTESIEKTSDETYTIPDPPQLDPLGQLSDFVTKGTLPNSGIAPPFGVYDEGKVSLLKPDNPQPLPTNLGIEEVKITKGVDIFGNKITGNVEGNKLGCCS